MSWKHREERIRLAIIWDLVKLDLLTCKTVSIKRDTRPLASVKTRSLALAEAPTLATETMQTEVDK